MILGEESPDEGTIRKRPRLRIGYLPQELETITGKTALDAAHRDEYPEHEAKRILSGLGIQRGGFFASGGQAVWRLPHAGRAGPSALVQSRRA